VACPLRVTIPAAMAIASVPSQMDRDPLQPLDLSCSNTMDCHRVTLLHFTLLRFTLSTGTHFSKATIGSLMAFSDRRFDSSFNVRHGACRDGDDGVRARVDLCTVMVNGQSSTRRLI
jgi:hypothetical protein